MTSHDDRGTTTAEYAVGTVGACTMALVLHAVATDGGWLDELMEIIQQALRWRRIFGDLPPLGIRW